MKSTHPTSSACPRCATASTLPFSATLLVLSLLLPGILSAQVRVPQSWKQVRIAPLPTFNPPQPKRIQLSNGMVIFLQEDHELPLIDGFARIRGGARSEPADKVGLTEVYGDVWRTGGTTNKTGDQLDDFLEARAAKVETGDGIDSTTIGFSCLKQDFEPVFQIFMEVMQQPAFREDKIALAKDQLNTSIARRNDSIDQIAGRESSFLGYGRDNPYARIPEYATVSAITRDDLLQWHKTYVHPNNMILGVVGDFDSATMEATLRKAFESLPSGPPVKAPEIEFPAAKPGYYLVDKEDVNQSIVRMVSLGTERRNPDYFAIEVFNEAFGGGFSSRLFTDIRTKMGLAYAVGGGIGTSFDHPGLQRFGVGTKSATTIESINALEKELNDINTDPISEQELKRAKDAILNSFVFNFDSPSKVLRERMAYEFYGYPADFLEQYRAGIEKVTTTDVARVASKYIHQKQYAVLVVGNTKDFDKPLDTLGPVTKLDVSIPGSPSPANAEGEAVPATPATATPTASNAEGKAIMAKVVAALGGEAKLQSVKSLRVKYTQIADTTQGRVSAQMETNIVFPDRVRANIESERGNVQLVVTPDLAFVSTPQGVHPLPDSQKKEISDQIKRDLLFVAQHANNSAFTFAADGNENIGDTQTRVLDVNSDGVTMRWYVDPQTGHVLRETYEAVGSSGSFHGQTDLSDWKTMDGLTLPAKHENFQNGKLSSTVETLDLQTNPTIDPKTFEMPPESTSPSSPAMQSPR